MPCINNIERRVGQIDFFKTPDICGVPIFSGALHSLLRNIDTESLYCFCAAHLHTVERMPVCATYIKRRNGFSVGQKPLEEIGYAGRNQPVNVLVVKTVARARVKIRLDIVRRVMRRIKYRQLRQVGSGIHIDEPTVAALHHLERIVRNLVLIVHSGRHQLTILRAAEIARDLNHLEVVFGFIWRKFPQEGVLRNLSFDALGRH